MMMENLEELRLWKAEQICVECVVQRQKCKRRQDSLHVALVQLIFRDVALEEQNVSMNLTGSAHVLIQLLLLLGLMNLGYVICHAVCNWNSCKMTMWGIL